MIGGDGDIQGMYYDIFNGDADGIFSLHQYRLQHPQEKTFLLTGVKRDICLLSNLHDVENSSLSVFDISLDANRSALLNLLRQGNRITYFDHHFAGDSISSPALESYIDTSATICTSLIVNKILQNQHGLWAICGAFGDNLHESAMDLAKKFHLSEKQTGLLRQLGELFNYNGYGSNLDELFFHPKLLYEAVRSYVDPFHYLEDSREIAVLQAGYEADITLAMQQKEITHSGKNRVYSLPDMPWAHRIVGVMSNIKARERTFAAHAIITENQDGSLRISVRAPLTDRRDADTLCKLFPTGGGRAAAAGINNLPKDMLDRFLNTFHSFFS
jgi:hypothetical protein